MQGKIVSSALKIEKQDNNDVQKYINTAKDIITSVRKSDKTGIENEGRTSALHFETEGVDKLIALNGWVDIVKN